MGALGLLVGRSLRANRRGIAASALIVALAGGVALTALAGARRTASAFPRYLEASDASDLAINVGPVEEGADYTIETTTAFAERARSIDGVVDDASYIGLEAMFPIFDGELGGGEVVGSLDGRFIDLDRVAVGDGRLPRPERVDEVFVNEGAATLADLQVGDPFTLRALGGFGEGNPLDAPVLGEEHVTVVGIGLFPEEVLSDDFDRSPRILTTPALTDEYLADAGSYLWHGLVLAPGTDIDRVIADYREIIGPDFSLIVQRTDEQVATVQRSMRPIVAGVAVFGIAALLGALALGILAGLRLTGDGSGDVATLRAVGLAPRQVALALGAPALATAGLGAVGAALLAAGLSPIAPFGAVRAIEPARGVDLDVTVLALGGLGLGVLLAVTALIGARTARRLRDRATSTRAALALALTTTGAPPASVVGAQQALGATGRQAGIPARSTLVACGAAVMAIATALVFGANVRTLLDDSTRYGWATDMAVSFGGGYEGIDPAGAAEVSATPGVESVAVAGFSPLVLGGINVSAMGLITQVGPPPVTLLSGDLPDAPNEVGLGSTTARRLHVSVGDAVEAEGGPPMQVTGLVALPAIGQQAAEHPSLGQGAVLDLAELGERHPGASYPVMVFVDLEHSTSAERARVTAVIARSMTDGLPPEAAEIYTDMRPGEIGGLDPAAATASALAGALGLAAVAALVVTLSASVRRQGRTFAILRALGFDSGQVRSTVRWQTNTTMVVALAVGLPLGLVVGRVAWRAFAEALGAVATPVLPVALIALAGVVLVAVANAVGEGPARRAARTSVQALREA
jgi:putative ABC transport system permease protein